MNRHPLLASTAIIRAFLTMVVLTAGAVVFMPSQVATAASTVAVPADIDATGANDVTAALNSFIASVPDNSIVEFPAGGRFRVEGSLLIQDRRFVTINGNGSTVFATTLGDRNRRHVYFRGGNDITVRNLHVKGANPNAGLGDLAYDSTRVGQHGFEFGGSDRVVLDNVSATDVFGDFVYFGRDDRDWRWSSNVTVMNSRFERNGRQGMSFTASRNVRVIGNRISEVRMVTFDMEPNGAERWGVEGVLIENNVVGSTRLNFVSAHGHGPVNDVTVTGNQLVNEQMIIAVYPELGTRRSNWTITNNTSDYVAHGSRGLIAIERVDGIRVTGNYHALDSRRDMPFVETWQSCGQTVHSNEVPGALVELRDNGGYDCPSSGVVPTTTSSTTSSTTSTTSSTTAPTTTVAPAPAQLGVTETATGNLNRGNPLWVYDPKGGAGTLSAELQYAKGRAVTLTLMDVNGAVLATARGASPVRLQGVTVSGGHRLVAHDLQGAPSSTLSLTVVTR